MLFTKARNLIAELTNHNTREKNLSKKKQNENEYRENKQAILTLLSQRGVEIECLLD